jgi:DNA-binding transcriptional MerR regulator
MTDKTYDIQELTTVSGVPRRTVYFYVQQGILPPPEGAGLAARYNEEHLLRLQLIPALRRQGLRLDEIRARFDRMDVEKMREMKEQTSRPAPRSIHEPTARPAPVPVPQPGWGEQRFTHYALPAGILLAAPENLDPVNRQRLQQLLLAARQIFSGSPYYSIDINQQTPASQTIGGSPEED